MSESEHVEIRERSIERHDDPERCDRCLEEYSEDLVLHGVDADGLEEFEAFYRAVRGTIPDLTVAIDRAIAEGDEVAVRYS